MIIDSILFSHELDILKLRLELMYPFVDYFIIVESQKTFRDESKELYFKKNIKMYEKFMSKIIYLEIDNFPKPKIDEQQFFWGNINWKNRCYQSNYIIHGINKIIKNNNLNNEDLLKSKIIFSDCDEILNPIILKDLSLLDLSKNKVHKFEMEFYYYNIFTKGEKNWYGAFLTTLDNMINLINKGERQVEGTRRNHAVPHIKNGGWHFSYFGDYSTQMTKINSIADVFKVSSEDLLNRINNYHDPLGRGGKINKSGGPMELFKNTVKENDFPEEIIFYQYNIHNEFSKIAFRNKSDNEIFFRLTKFYYNLFKELKNEKLFILTYDDNNFFKTLKNYFTKSEIRKFCKNNSKDYIWDIAFIKIENIEDIKNITNYFNYKKLVIESDILLNIKYNNKYETENYPIFDNDKKTYNNFISNKELKKKYIYIIRN